MPKRARELGPLEVRRLVNKPGLHAVGGVAGLLLQVTRSGATSWILRTMAGGKRRDIGLGSFPDVTLAQAREKARQVKDRIREGVDPVAERRAARHALIESQRALRTFRDCAKAYHLTQLASFRSKKHAADWINSLEIHAFPVIGDFPVAGLGLSDILQVLERVWTTKTETASRVRQRMEKVLDYAKTMGYRGGDNPAAWRGNLDAVLPKPSKVSKVKHHRALPWLKVPGFMSDLRAQQSMGARALEFIILTAARSGEVRFATWDEIDLDARVWTVPAVRMKAGKEHRVPLSEDAIELLKRLPRFEDSNYLFTSPRGGPLSDMTISAVCRRMKADAVPHGFRSSFRDWCAEATNYPHAVAEMALAHTIGNKVEAAYRRGDLFEKRVRLMRDWAQFLNNPAPAGEVVEMNALERKRRKT